MPESVDLFTDYKNDITKPAFRVEMDLVNYALLSEGTTTEVSSTYAGDYNKAALNDGDRTHKKYGQNGVWRSDGVWTEWLQFNFNNAKTINRFEIFFYPKNTRVGIVSNPGWHTAKQFKIYYQLDGSVDWNLWTGLENTIENEETPVEISGGIVTNNDKSYVVLQDFTGLSNVRKVKIEFIEPVQAGSQYMVCEVEIYKVADVSEFCLDFSPNRRKDIYFNRYASSVLDITLDNKDRRFSPKHIPTSAEVTDGFFNQDIRPDIRVRGYIGLDKLGATKLIPSGYFYVSKWSLDARAENVSITAKDRIKYLGNKDIELEETLSGKFLEYLIEFLGLHANMSSDEMILDETFTDTQYFFPKTDEKIWSEMQKLSEAVGDSYLYIDEQGRLVYKVFLDNIPHEWKQTTQTEFESGSLDKIDSTTISDSLLLEKETLTHQDFREGLAGGRPAFFDEYGGNPWYVTVLDNEGYGVADPSRDAYKRALVSRGQFFVHGPDPVFPHFVIRRYDSLGIYNMKLRMNIENIDEIIEDPSLFEDSYFHIAKMETLINKYEFTQSVRLYIYLTMQGGEYRIYYQFTATDIDLYGTTEGYFEIAQEDINTWQDLSFTVDENSMSFTLLGLGGATINFNPVSGITSRYQDLMIAPGFDSNLGGGTDDAQINMFFDNLKFNGTKDVFYFLGKFVSQTKDIGTTPLSWGSLDVFQFKPVGTNISYFTQTSNDGITWDSEVAVSPAWEILSALKRYIRIVAYFTTADGFITPQLDEFVLNYFTGSPSPRYSSATRFSIRYDDELSDFGQTISDEYSGENSLYTRVTVKTSPYFLQTTAKIWEANTPFLLPNGSTTIYDCELTDPCEVNENMKLYINAYTFTGGEQENSEMKVTFTKHPRLITIEIYAKTELTITTMYIEGQQFKKTGVIQSIAQAESDIVQKYGERDFSYENEYIYVKSTADKIASDMLSRYKLPRVVLDKGIKTQFCPAVKVGDKVRITELNTSTDNFYEIIGVTQRVTDTGAETELQAFEISLAAFEAGYWGIGYWGEGYWGGVRYF